jgi:hypothetical protein
MGAFILFGAPMIVSGLSELGRSGGGVENGSAGAVAPNPVSKVPTGYDPDTGAAVPWSGG